MTPPAGSTQRVFIALDPPREVRDELAGWIRTISLGPAARPVPPANMHLTMAFLGNRTESEIASAVESLREVARPLGELATGAPAWLPGRKPRALAVEIHDPEQQVAHLNRDLLRELSASLDIEEPRRFRPHITVARFGRGARPTRELPPTPAAGFAPRTLTLYRSILSERGASYEELASTLLDPGSEDSLPR